MASKPGMRPMMGATAHSPAFVKKTGMPETVAQEKGEAKPKPKGGRERVAEAMMKSKAC